MVSRKMERGPEDVVERAEFVGRTVEELCELLRAGASYPQVTVRCKTWATVQNKPHSPRGESERGGGPPLSEGPAGRAARLRSFSASAGAFPANEAVRAHGHLTSAPLSMERIERARGALESIRVALWQRELVRTLRTRGRRAA